MQTDFCTGLVQSFVFFYPVSLHLTFYLICMIAQVFFCFWLNALYVILVLFGGFFWSLYFNSTRFIF